MLSEIENVRIKLMNNATSEYDAIISLGGSCATCLQLRKRELQTYAYPFDYVFCENAQFQFEMLAKLFETNFEGWLKKKNIIPLEEKERGISDLFQYKDGYTGYRYIHDFKKKVSEDGVYEAFYEKYNRRLKRLYDKIENSKRIMFISDSVSNLTFGDVQRFMDVIHHKWKNKKFKLSIMNFNSRKDEILEKNNVKIVNLSREKNNYDFFGMNYEWGWIMDDLKLSSSKGASFVEKNKKFSIKNIFNRDKNLISKNDVFLITGCSSGLGKIWSELLLNKGYKVVATARNIESIEYLSKKYPKKSLCLNLDVTKPDMIKSVVEKSIDKFGKIDVLINNAGIGYFALAEKTDIEQAKKVFDVNFFGALNTIQEVLPSMRKNKKGLIINTSSISAICSNSTAGIYSGSKASLEALNDSLSKEVKNIGIKTLLLDFGETVSNFYKNSMVCDDVPADYDYVMSDLLEDFKKSKYYNPQNGEEIIRNLIKFLEINMNIPERLFLGKETLDVAKQHIDLIKNSMSEKYLIGV